MVCLLRLLSNLPSFSEMARANLNIQTAINEAFLQAHDARDVRLLRVKIEDENLVLDGVVNRVGTPAEDFNTILLDTLQDNQALFILYRVVDEVSESSPWTLIAWVPDGCRVRDKMLYSSSKEDLKRSIGLGFFRADYAANQRSDMTWKQYQQSQDRTFDADVLTESERLVMEEKQQVLVESSASKAAALSVLPFAMSAEVTAQLDSFKNGECNWVEMTIVNEVINLVGFRTVSASDSLQPFIDSENASFIAVRLPSKDPQQPAGKEVRLFIFSCPENTPVRLKMTMSSSKASVLAAAQQMGVTFEKALEIRDAADVDYAVQEALGAGADDRTGSPLPGGANSSSAANLSHGKPQRPGRGKVKVGKFKLDEEA